MDAGHSVSTDTLGNSYVTGQFQSPSITFGGFTLTNADPIGNTSDFFIAEYDVSGNILWAKSVGGQSYDQGSSVSTDVSGNSYVVGVFSAPTITIGTFTLTSAGFTDVFIAKYDALGAVLWAKSAGGSGNDQSYSVSADAFGNAYVTAASWGILSSPTMTFGSITLTPPAGSVDPMCIVKYDSNGNVLCASALSSGGDDQSGISADPFGNAYITGDFMSDPFVVGSDTLVLTGMENVFVAKYTCCNTPTVTVFADPSSICAGNTINIYASGANNYSWNTGATTAQIQDTPTITTTYTVTGTNAPGCTDVTTITITVSDCPNAISEINSAFSLVVSPNPFSESAVVTMTGLEGAQSHELKIFDVLGNEVKNLLITGKQTALERGNLADGIYFYKIISADKNIITGKFVVGKK